MTESTPLAIEMWPIKKVLPYANNAKQHPDKQLDQLSESIKKFGFVNPVLVDANGVLIAGHGRVASAQKLGLKKIPVIQLGHLSEVDAKALRLSDNAIADRGVWSPELVELELTNLRALNFDLGPLGLDSIALPELDEDIIPAAPKRIRNKTTIFISVLNQDVEKARKAIAGALKKAQIECSL
jgi:ParB-like chromosome segregation protein Spo0J